MCFIELKHSPRFHIFVLVYVKLQVRPRCGIVQYGPQITHFQNRALAKVAPPCGEKWAVRRGLGPFVPPNVIGVLHVERYKAQVE